MRFWFDTEFIEKDWRIDPISIGVVSEDGREYYAEFEGCDLERGGEWIKQHVIPQLTGPQKTLEMIREELNNFFGFSPKIWGYYADYDWVLLAMIFGSMIDLPPSWPRYCRDVKQLCSMLGNPKLPSREGVTHNALEDAKWTRKAWKYLYMYEMQTSDKRTALI